MEVPQKLKIKLSHDPAIPILGTYSKEMKSVSQRDICTPMSVAASVTIAKIRKPKCPSMNGDVVYIFSRILFSHKKMENLSSATT